MGIMMTDPGTIEKIYGWSFCAGSLPLKVAEEMTYSAKKHLKTSGCELIDNISIDIETYKEDRDCCPFNGNGIVIVAKKSTREAGITAAEEFLEAVDCGGWVDKHIQDQM